jgi:UDP-glucose 4-epimerase
MKKLEETKLIINGNNYNTNDGTCVRDYVHVVDIANAAIMSLENLNCTYMTMNVCSGNPMSNKQIADKVGVQYEYGLTRKGDPDTLFGSNALIKNILEWKPRYTLEQMIESTEKWYNDKLIM